MLNRTLAGRLAVALLLGGVAAIPAAATPPADAVAQRQDADSIVVTWQAAGPVDVLVADQADAPAKAARMVSAADRDGRAIIAQPASGRAYILLRDARNGDVARVAERVLPLEAGSNFRDIGGYPAANGRHVKWGLIYRSGGTPLLTEADRARIAALGLTNMIDLRSSEERVIAPSRIEGLPYTAVGYSMVSLMGGANGGSDMEGAYRRMPALLAAQMREIFVRLLRAEAPLAYNCSAGQDRTGFATALVLSALGTPYQTIIADYHLSTTYRRPQFEMPRIDAAQHSNNPVAALFARYQDDPRALQPQPLMTAAGKPYLDFAFAELNEKWGGVDGYLRQELGLTTADIARLRKHYTM